MAAAWSGADGGRASRNTRLPPRAAAVARRQIATKLFSRLAIFARDICRPLRSDSPQIGFRFLPGVEIDLYLIFNSLHWRTVVVACLSNFNLPNYQNTCIDIYKSHM